MPENPLAYKDTVSRCETYSNPYDSRSHPDFELARQRLQAKRLQAIQDNMETDQQKLERQLVEQFQRSQYGLPGEKLYIIGQFGKYFFLAFTLPPYIFFYGMPKWLIENAMMPAIKKMFRGGNKVKESIQNITQRVVLQLQQVQKAFKNGYETVKGTVLWPFTKILKFTQNITNAIKEAIKEARKESAKEKEITNAIPGTQENKTAEPKKLSFLEKTVAFALALTQLPQKIKSVMIDIPVKYVQKTFEAFVSNIQPRWEAFKKVVDVREPLKVWFQAQAQAVYARIQPLYQVPIKVAVKIYEKTIEIAKEVIVNRIVEPIRQRYEPIKEAAKVVVQGVQQVVQKVQEKVQNFIAAYPVHYWNKTQEVAKNVSEKVVDFAEKIKEKVKIFTKAVVETVKYTMEVVQHSAQLAYKVVVPWVMAQIHVPITIAQTLFVGGTNVLVFVAHKIVEKSRNLVSKVKNLLNSGWNGAKKALNFVKNKGQALYRKYIYPVISFFTVSNVIYLFRLILAWVKILLKLGWLILTDLFKEAFSVRK